MRNVLARSGLVLMVLGLPAGSPAQPVPRADDIRRVERLVATIAQEAATLCPLTDPGDQQALDRCRSALSKDSYVKRSLDRIVLWGRPSPGPGVRLKAPTLTQFGTDVPSGLSLPMFMFHAQSPF